VQRLKDPETRELLPEARLWIPETCGRCHNEIYQKYRESVHGSAVLGEGNPDAPTCTDCHGSHQIEDPTTAEFRLNSPEICAGCHTDPKIMNKYGISTDVLDTYVADFHGTSLVLFEPKTPDAQFNKPVCYDCHGVHDIVRADDPNKGLHVRENLLARCQECHPDATTSFPGAWLSHYIPSREKYPLIYYVNLFYKIMIPMVLGGMGILVAMDFGRMMLNRYRQRKKTTVSAPPHPSESEAQHG
jgi:predicted CXXCH cytochrome family protein